MTDIQLELLSRMTPAQKLAVAQQLRATAWKLTASGVRMREPGLTSEEVEERVRQIFLRASS